MHAAAAIHCMERGKHVYTQKPLVRTIKEARMMVEAANKYKVATQMGNQGYSNEGTRQCAEMIWAGEIGNVTEVHAWTDRPIWPQGLTSIPAPSPVPATLDWDLWLGIANFREYTAGGEGYPEKIFGGNFYQHFNWRGFYDFGCGALGDMACHILGAPNLALKLGAPSSVDQEGRRQQLPIPQGVHHQVRVSGARQHAAGDAVLVRRPEGTAQNQGRAGGRIPGRPAQDGYWRRSRQ
jgi:predicted dehydrogenase